MKFAQRAAAFLLSRVPLDVKGWSELRYWRRRHAEESTLANGHYEYFFTTHFQFDRSFYRGKRVLDIGCGPRGSLEWADMALERVGLDPLVDAYRKFGIDTHRMRYVKAGSENIPFPDGHFDVVSSFNSLDHVNDVSRTVEQIKRVVKPGGWFLLIVETGHEPRVCEPHELTFSIVEQFFPVFRVVDELKVEKPQVGIYESLRDGIAYRESDPTQRAAILSVKFQKQLVAI